MTRTANVGRHWALAVTLLAAGVALVGMPAQAGPVGAPVPVTAVDPEGGSKTLRDQLDAAARGYIDAKARYDFSKRTQAVLVERIRTTELRLALIVEQVSVVAAASYRTGRLGVVTALLESGSPDAFLDRATSVELLAMQEDAQLADLRHTQRLLAQQRDRINAEMTMQTVQLAEMEKRKRDAERALAAVGGRVSGGFVSGSSPAARPAPRNSDGTWPRESCTVNDPTTTGCLTPRMYHAYLQTKAAGFTRYVSCYRPSGYGEHPKGRACDWAAQVGGFGGTAYGSDKYYGDRLASFYVANADRLGVMYVIWYRQIWMPGTGWRSYSAGSDPASAHTNHVHVSVY
ncbi:MAG TPA: hypothetical protein VFM54_24185 [Micromonosporaceae bacterium]|nr:hypothetical protein [Micromonosporaceae bacterium]